MKQKIIQIGSSQGVIIPKEMMDKLGYKVGDELYVVDDQAIKGLVLSEKQLDSEYNSGNAKFMELVEEIDNKYKTAWDNLSNK